MIGPELISFAGMHTIIKLQCDLIKAKEAFSRKTHTSFNIIIILIRHNPKLVQWFRELRLTHYPYELDVTDPDEA